MKLFKILGGTLAAALLVAGCGSGSTLSGQGSSSGGGGGSSVASVTVSASPATIAADGSTTSTITAIARDANNAFVSGAAVTFAASAGGLAIVSGTTDTSGTATATLSASGAAAGTVITVTATINGIAKQTTVNVVAMQQSLTVNTDAPQIPSDGTKSANIAAVLRDANNVALPGITVIFAADSGVLTVTQAVTDSTGLAKATLNAGADPTNRTITVTASAGSATPATLPVTVTGTTLTLSGPTNLVQNASGSYVATLTNSSGQGIPGRTVTVSSTAGNTLSGTTLTTDGSGRAAFSMTGVNGGTDTLSATALGLLSSLPVSVSTQSFLITSPADGTKVNLGTSQTVTVTWKNNGVAVANQPVTFSATRGTLVPNTPVMTDANGVASVSISSVGAGPSIVAATAASVAAQIGLDFVATVPSQISLQATPASVAVQGSSTLTALVRDAQNNLVEGATVDFVISSDPTNGSLSVSSAPTDNQGRAQAVYTAGNSTSGANGVTITATVHGTAISSTTQLSVGGQTVFLSLGTGNKIDDTQGAAIYVITYAVFAVDAQGIALANVPITLKLLPVAYGKGVLGCGMGAQYWSPVYSTAATDPDAIDGQLCKNEDTDYTGNIDSLGLDGSGNPVKDYNLDGKLWPGNIAVVSPGNGNTDASGKLTVTITYPRDHSYWVEVQLVATTGTQGSENTATSKFILRGTTTDYSCSIGPPGPVSPYGVASTCKNPN